MRLGNQDFIRVYVGIDDTARTKLDSSKGRLPCDSVPYRERFTLRTMRDADRLALLESAEYCNGYSDTNCEAQGVVPSARHGIITRMSDVTRILSQIESGDPSAATQLLPLVYDELRRLAAAKLTHEKPGQTLQATAMLQVNSLAYA